jgi:hypothetical protein
MAAPSVADHERLPSASSTTTLLDDTVAVM